MAQVFSKSMNSISRATLAAIIIALIIAGWVLAEVYSSSYMTNQGVIYAQPIPFSHEHHVSGLGIDCRYCHTGVETSAFAGIPPTQTCMTCHSQIWTNAVMLQPVRDSWATNQPIRWRRIHNLPDYVFFNHSIHIRQGIGCVTCHGQVDRMPLMYQAASLEMRWCLDCHRNPQRFVRPRDQVFNMNWLPPESQSTLGARLVREYKIRVGELDHCYICHR